MIYIGNMIGMNGLHKIRGLDSGKHPCGVCRKGVVSNSILCVGISGIKVSQVDS